MQTDSMKRMVSEAFKLDFLIILSNLSIVPSENSSDGSVIPALGSTWAHFVNVRIILQYLDDERREVTK